MLLHGGRHDRLLLDELLLLGLRLHLHGPTSSLLHVSTADYRH